MSVRVRLTVMQTLLLGVVLAAFAVIVYAAVAAQEVSQLNYELRLQADDLQERALGVRLQAARGRSGLMPSLADNADTGNQRQGAPAVMSRALHLPNETVNAAMTDLMASRPFSAQLVTGAGQAIAYTADRRVEAPIGDEFWNQVMAAGHYAVAVEVDGRQYQMLGTRVEAGRFSDRLLLTVLAPLAPVEATLAAWRLSLALIVVGATGVSAAIAWFMATRALRPVDRMTTAARAIGAAADFSRRIPEPEQADELGRLARTFNDMLDRLAVAYDSQRRFLADASHELRTPLTVIGTNAAALLRGGEPDPAAREETLQAIARETGRMSRLVADLLTLARVDAGQELDRRRLAFDAVVLDVYQQQRGLTNGVRLRIGDWEQVEVNADSDRVKQAVLNLVDNAIRYTPAGGTVTLDLVRAGNAAILRVHDTGIGIPIEHQRRIFERFYRVDGPRARQVGGTGLGLAIAQDVVTMHGGRLELVSQPGAGSTFSLVLPVCNLAAEHASAVPPSAGPIQLPVPV